MTDSKVIDLASRRKSGSTDPDSWTPLEALKYTIERIERGELDPCNIFIAMEARDQTKKVSSFPFVCAGPGTKLEFCGLLSYHAKASLEE
jgi:hypothetical protein